MGTRAQFFIGNPHTGLDGRKWLGCIAFDGYPDGDCSTLNGSHNEDDFERRVKTLAGTRDDWCDPVKHGFPFPWTDDLFLTDYTYAFFDGAVYMTNFHSGWIRLEDFLGDQAAAEAYDIEPDRLPSDVPAPTVVQDTSAPDSIMILTLR